MLQAISSRYGSTRQRNEPKLGVLETFFFESGQFLTETIGNIGLKLNTAPFFFSDGLKVVVVVVVVVAL